MNRTLTKIALVCYQEVFRPRSIRSSGPSLDPNASGLPGTATLQSLVNGLAWWALLAALVGLVAGAGMWALGAHSNNYQHTSSGRRAVLVSGAAALLIGAAPTILDFLFNAGKNFH
ncbi:MAG TPA: DUF6112 family protein [Acidimicrobiales bacterium]|nr:DUF6112 family protein [Acidimicrobiales bacterium]